MAPDTLRWARAPALLRALLEALQQVSHTHPRYLPINPSSPHWSHLLTQCFLSDLQRL